MDSRKKNIWTYMNISPERYLYICISHGDFPCSWIPLFMDAHYPCVGKGADGYFVGIIARIKEMQHPLRSLEQLKAG